MTSFRNDNEKRDYVEKLHSLKSDQIKISANIKHMKMECQTFCSKNILLNN